MKIAVYSERDGWLVDLCVGPEWSWDVNEATWWDSEDEAREALTAADVSAEPWFKFIRVK